MNGKSNFELVRDWMVKAGQECPVSPEDIIPRCKLRERLIDEEYKEMKEEIIPVAGSDYVKELADLLIVVYGAFADLGVDADEIVKIVMENNTKKLESKVVRPDGKITTPLEVKKQLKEEVYHQIRREILGD